MINHLMVEGNTSIRKIESTLGVQVWKMVNLCEMERERSGN